MTGPPPKPAERRQRRNARTSVDRAGIGLVPVHGGAVAVPPAPDGLLSSTKVAWVAFWASPLAPLVTAADFPALERWATLVDERARALRGYRKARIIDAPSGQAMLNPLFGVMKALDAEIRALEDRFGLSPMARLRLGAQLGETARSLEELNAGLDDDDEPDDDGPDPRVRVMDATARPAPADAGPKGVPVDGTHAGPRRRGPAR